MKKLSNLLFNKITTITFFLLLQILLFLAIIQIFSDKWFYIHIVLIVISFLVVLFLISKDDNPMFKISWLLLILIFPLFGGLSYLIVRAQKFSYKIQNQLNQSIDYRLNILKNPNNKLYIGSRYERYLNNFGFPTYKNTKSYFLDSGISKLEELLKSINQAEKFIFMEYFIITKSLMWDKILDALLKKIDEGVEVKIIYDDFGSSAKLPHKYYKFLKSKGIDVAVFNPMTIKFNFALNYRDHRKIIVIDNKVAFTGGINIGDEYINKKKKFGHWHDAAIKVEGEAVKTFTTIFLEMWAFTTKQYLEPSNYLLPHSVDNDASYIPYSDIPLVKSFKARNMFLQLINDAKNSLYITTPYLILDNEISTALKLASESGVKVSIIIPSIPDKKLVFMVSKAYAKELADYGVSIYEYEPGFIHSKIIVVDESLAMIGTSNLDFRSLYLHFENNLLLNDLETINDMMSYINQAISDSKLITKEQLKKRNIFYRILQSILKTFSTIL